MARPPGRSSATSCGPMGAPGELRTRSRRVIAAPVEPSVAAGRLRGGWSSAAALGHGVAAALALRAFGFAVASWARQSPWPCRSRRHFVLVAASAVAVALAASRSDFGFVGVLGPAGFVRRIGSSASASIGGGVAGRRLSGRLGRFASRGGRLVDRSLRHAWTHVGAGGVGCRLVRGIGSSPRSAALGGAATPRRPDPAGRRASNRQDRPGHGRR